MRKSLDCRGMIGPNGTHAIGWSILYKALTLAYGDIEIRLADRRSKDGWDFYYLVSNRPSRVRELALVRWCYDTKQLQEQIQGPFGQELWVDVEWKPPASGRLSDLYES
jgi:hypothetical protein